MVTVTKLFTFDSAHFLPEYDGKCARLHGHCFLLEVEVCKTKETEKLCHYDGMVMDFGDLKDIVESNVVGRLDHQCLNDVLPVIPTAENMVEWIADQLQTSALGQSVQRIRLWETPNSFAEWRR
jgi:6-pyruvoyltetrahydropterin/6-carboxytetrahydropterin synthase